MVTNNEKIRKGLSSRESFLLSKLSSRGKRIIEIKDIENALNTNYKNAKKTASELERKGWLDRLSRGKYLIIPLEAGERSYYTEHEFLIASRLVSPYYIGFLSALNFHGMTEQTPMTVFIATTKRVRNRTVHGISYSFVTLKKSRFFGYREYAVTNKVINISDPEKTIIDCMNHLEYSGGIEEVVKGLKNPLNLENLVEYAIRMGNGAAIKRLHYLLHTLEYPIPEGLERHLKDNYSRSYSLLDPTRPDKGNYNSTWMLRLNIPEKDLLGDVY